MNNLTKQYLKNIKAFFPIVGKQEKNYLKKLEIHIEDYCEDNVISSLEDLYKNFGNPAEIVNTYYSTIDTEHILKQIKKSHIIKTCLIVLITSCLILVTFHCAISYRTQQIFEKQQLFSEDYIIE